MTNYTDFKSGSDIRGYACGDESKSPYLTDEAVQKITYGFIKWLGTENKRITVAVGNDCRLSADRIKSAVISVLISHGISVKDCGVSSTPAMFMTTVEAGCTAAVQITASHHPKDRNGLKFFTREGGLNGGDIAQILKSADGCDNPFGELSAECEKLDFMSVYAAGLRKMIIDGVNAQNRNKPLEGKKIVVDAGNGVGGFYAYDVLKHLGADITGSVYLEPDGNFPNHAPNPENKEAMDCVSRAAAAADADLGVIFDTDVDRAACVGRGGLEINRNRFVALASRVALKGNEGGTVVTDSVTSDGLSDFIKNNGGVHLRYMRGYRNVINKQLELNASGVNCPLAMETSGHAAFRDNNYLDDGAYLITRLIIEMASLAKQGKSLEDLLDGLAEPLDEKELRFAIKAQDFKAAGQRIIEHFKTVSHNGWAVCGDNYEGIRINVPGGWFLLRLSVHDPIIVLNAESTQKDGCCGICREVYGELVKAQGCNDIDASALWEYIK